MPRARTGYVLRVQTVRLSTSPMFAPLPAANEEAAAALVDAVRTVVQHLRATQRTAESRAGVHAAELLVLRKLAEAPAVSLAELAARTQTDPSTASVIVSQLVGRGLVERQSDPIDRRRTPIAITAAGYAALIAAPESVSARVARAVGPDGAESLRALATQLEELAARLARERVGPDGQHGQNEDGDGRR